MIVEAEMTIVKAKKSEGEIVKLPLEDSLRNVLQESRMLLPGLQTLFGFQLIAVFNEGFSKLSTADRTLYLLSLICALISMALLTTPAAYDRQSHCRHATEYFVRLSSTLIAIALFPLMTALCLDTYLVTKHIFNNQILSVSISGAMVLLFTSLWYLLPRLRHVIGNDHKE